jgi:hypothetical protein
MPPQMLGCPAPAAELPPHVAGAVHVPQLIVLPQPSPTGPQLTAVPPGPTLLQVFGTHAGAPHWFAVPPPPQVEPEGHVVQLIVPPHPSLCVPHVPVG